MLKKSLFSPARPRHAKTCLFPCGVLDIRDAYLVKRRSFLDSFGRFTFYVSPFTNDKEGASAARGMGQKGG
jgi:hypothetical protein